ncbi:hypothetical protein [Streptomyces candidus]|uniref:Uncharacterized protein n=1 Tax=Streptomyces candidus TaxID=67283 RepID=A0A7X0HM82_9ACTN|nr:hypothetical protein [Streptomyces candidus]MBB6440141.1 hypothetical protein [Streptomyces candidus]GHH57587.1 hypothetical protein GCM10018773_65110 [Streptomyces candidus]
MQLPSAFLDWEQDDIFDEAGERTTAVITMTADGARLLSPCGHSFSLVRIRRDEYRLAGWSDERTVETTTVGRDPEVILRQQRGRAVTELALPARALHAGS